MRANLDQFGLSDVLGLSRQLGSLVMEGCFYRLHRQSVDSAASEYAELKGARRRVSPVEQVETLFSRSLERHADSLEDFRARCVRINRRHRFRLTDELKRRLGNHSRLRFVADTLIPHLRKLAASPFVDATDGLDELRPLDDAFGGITEIDDTPRDVVQRALGGDALILGQNVYQVSWEAGDVRPRDCYLRANGEQFSVNALEPRPLIEVDGAFKRELREALKGNLFDHQNDHLVAQARALEEDLARVAQITEDNIVLYRDRERTVTVGHDMNVFVRQQIPPFVAEGPDKKLYLYQSVQVGVRLESLDPKTVLPQDGAYVMQKYDHVFVFSHGALGKLCMGHDHPFFRRFWEMPLEQGIVEYLNAARLVICAGHFDSGDLGLDELLLEPDRDGERSTITEAAARKRKLPIYRYYRTCYVDVDRRHWCGEVGSPLLPSSLAPQRRRR